MGTFLQTKNPVVVSTFHAALLHQMLLIGLVLVFLSVLWNILRTTQYRRLVAAGSFPGGKNLVTIGAEPVARRVLRIGFGLLWILDALLQLQSAMPLGLPPSVLQPSASTSPGWVQHVVHISVKVWTDHPVQAAASAVWLQLGIGALLLLAPRGWWSRLAGVAAVGWGLVVWVFGEAFGGIFGSGASWLFGTPGAVLFYCMAGALVALPDRAWSSPRLGRLILRGAGLFLIGMAVLQAWPGRGSWQGSVRGTSTGTLTAMVRDMAQTPQPGPLASAVRGFGRFDASHGWGVNLFVVIMLAAIGIALSTANRRVVRSAMSAAVALCLADWVLVQDFGFFGGVGTDPNSMVPMALIFVSGYLAVVKVPAPLPIVVPSATDGAPVDSDAVGVVETTPWWDRVAPGYLARVLAAVAAVAVVLVGAVPMAAASVNPNADPILAVAVDGTPNIVNLPAPAFQLVDQTGRTVSLASLRGRTVALTFLDPVCTSDCPLIAQEFRGTNSLLGADSSRVVFVAVVANPIYRTTALTNAFDRQEGLEHMTNWLFLTGSVSALEHVWGKYGIEADVLPAGAMVAHSDLAYLIDARGHTREVLSANPGDGSSSASSSFSEYLAEALERVIHT
ncbi:MAG TPA: SCO family protein [Acidimicrobiales bacterium]|nr:SCO family protein [Acidimicrobiales bacterium]